VMRDGKSGCWPSERKRKVGDRWLRHLKNECYSGAEDHIDTMVVRTQPVWSNCYTGRIQKQRNAVVIVSDATSGCMTIISQLDGADKPHVSTWAWEVWCVRCCRLLVILERSLYVAVSSSPAAAAAAAAADDDDDDDAPSGKPYVLLALFTYSHTSETITSN